METLPVAIITTRHWTQDFIPLTSQMVNLLSMLIAYNIYSQIDDEGNAQMLLDEIVDLWADGTAVAQNKGHAIH
jgi:hypothetical protein